MTALLGHDAQAQAFDAAAASGALHHAWLLVGPVGVGKASFAKAAGFRLVGGSARDAAMIAARSHPDFRLVEREVWDKANPPRIVPYDQRKEGDAPARSIRIAQIRMLEPVLAVRPSLGERRVIIIDAADDLERPAANALLKSLEEPPAGTVFLLVSHAPGRLLPTIRSRCRLLRFDPLDDAAMRLALAAALPEADAAELDALVAAGEGAPGRALGYAGLDVGGLDHQLQAIAADGDPQNARRVRLAKALGPKAAQPRYEAFLDRVPALIARAARGRQGEGLRTALDAHAAAVDIAGAARGLSLDQQATVFELAGVVARLAPGAPLR
jgi:DNA polymerase III subunit delta'